jgi:Tfp pilus assembly protein PilW
MQSSQPWLAIGSAICNAFARSLAKAWHAYDSNAAQPVGQSTRASAWEWAHDTSSPELSSQADGAAATQVSHPASGIRHRTSLKLPAQTSNNAVKSVLSQLHGSMIEGNHE